MPPKQGGGLGRHSTGASNFGRGSSSLDRKNALQTLNTTPVAVFNTTLPTSYISDKEAESVIVSVVKDLAEREKVRQCGEKENLVVYKIEKEARDCEEAYKAAVHAQPDFLNIMIDPALKSHALFSSRSFSRLVLNQTVACFRRMNSAGDYVKEEDPVLLDPTFFQPQPPVRADGREAIPPTLFDRVCAEPNKEMKKQILRDFISTTGKNHVEALDDYLERPPRLPRTPPPVFVAAASVAPAAVLYSGWGYARFVTGVVYEGEWAEGLMHGRGVVAWPDGTVYQGEVSKGTVHGRGRLLHVDGSYYVGEWSEGYRHGLGVWVHPAAGLCYRGVWARGRRHGLGTMFYREDRCVYYHGEWVCGAREGAGVMRYSDECVYEGEWLRDQRHGRGAAVFSNGDCYVGEWEHNLMHGDGEYVWGDLRGDGEAGREGKEDTPQRAEAGAGTLEEYVRGHPTAPSLFFSTHVDVGALAARAMAQRPLPSLREVGEYVAALAQGADARVTGGAPNTHTCVQHALRTAGLDSSTLLAVAHAIGDPHACEDAADEAADAAAVYGPPAALEDTSVAAGNGDERILLSLDQYLRADAAAPDARAEVAPRPSGDSLLPPFLHASPLLRPDAPLEDAVARSGPAPLLPLPTTLARAACAEVSAPHAYADGLLATADPLLRRNRYLGSVREGVRTGWGAQLYSSGAAYCGEWVDGQKHGRGVFVFDNGLRVEGAFEHDQLRSREWARVDTSHWQLPLADLLADSVRTLWPPSLTTIAAASAEATPTAAALPPLVLPPGSPSTSTFSASTSASASASRRSSAPVPAPPSTNTARLRAARAHQRNYEASVAAQVAAQQQRLARVLARHGHALYCSLRAYASVEDGAYIAHEHNATHAAALDSGVARGGAQPVSTTLPPVYELPEPPVPGAAQDTRTHVVVPGAAQAPVATLKSVRVRVSALRRLCRDAGLLRGSVTELRVSELASHRYCEWVCHGHAAREHEDHIVFHRHAEDVDNGRAVLLPRHALETLVRVCAEHACESTDTLDELQVRALCQEDAPAVLAAAAAQQGVPSVLLRLAAADASPSGAAVDTDALLASSPLRTPLSLLPLWAQVKHLLETLALPRLGARQHMDWLAAHACALTRDLQLPEADAAALLSTAEGQDRAHADVCARGECLTPRGNTDEYDAAHQSASVCRAAVQEACAPCGVWPAEDARTRIFLIEPRAAPLASVDVHVPLQALDEADANPARHWHTAMRALRALVSVSADRRYLHRLSLRTCEPFPVEGACRGEGLPCPCVSCARTAFFAGAPPQLAWFGKAPRAQLPRATRVSVQELLALLSRHGVVTRGLYTEHTRALQWFADMVGHDNTGLGVATGASPFAAHRVDASLFIPHTHAQLPTTADALAGEAGETMSDCRGFFLRGDTGELQRVRTAGKDKTRPHRVEAEGVAAPSEAACASRSRLQYEVEVEEGVGQRALQEQLFSDHALTHLHVALLALAHMGAWDAAAQEATRVLCYLAYACASTVFLRECALAIKLQQWRTHILAFERRAHEQPPPQERKHKKGGAVTAAAAQEPPVDAQPYMARFAAWQASSAGAASSSVGLPLISDISMTLQAHRVGLRASRAVLEAMAVRASHGEHIDGERLISALREYQDKARAPPLQPCCASAHTSPASPREAAAAQTAVDAGAACTRCSAHVLAHARAHAHAVQDALTQSRAALQQDAAGADMLVLLAQELGALSVCLGVDSCGMGECVRSASTASAAEPDTASASSTGNPYARMCVNVLHRSALLATHNTTPAATAPATSTVAAPASSSQVASPGASFLPSPSPTPQALAELLPATAFPLSHCAPALHLLLEEGSRACELGALLERELHMDQALELVASVLALKHQLAQSKAAHLAVVAAALTSKDLPAAPTPTPVPVAVSKARAGPAPAEPLSIPPILPPASPSHDTASASATTESSPSRPSSAGLSASPSAETLAALRTALPIFRLLTPLQVLLVQEDGALVMDDALLCTAAPHADTSTSAAASVIPIEAPQPAAASAAALSLAAPAAAASAPMLPRPALPCLALVDSLTCPQSTHACAPSSPASSAPTAAAGNTAPQQKQFCACAGSCTGACQPQSPGPAWVHSLPAHLRALLSADSRYVPSVDLRHALPSLPTYATAVTRVPLPLQHLHQLARASAAQTTTGMRVCTEVLFDERHLLPEDASAAARAEQLGTDTTSPVAATQPASRVAGGYVAYDEHSLSRPQSPIAHADTYTPPRAASVAAVRGIWMQHLRALLHAADQRCVCTPSTVHSHRLAPHLALLRAMPGLLSHALPPALPAPVHDSLAGHLEAYHALTTTCSCRGTGVCPHNAACYAAFAARAVTELLCKEVSAQMFVLMQLSPALQQRLLAYAPYYIAEAQAAAAHAHKNTRSLSPLAAEVAATRIVRFQALPATNLQLAERGCVPLGDVDRRDTEPAPLCECPAADGEEGVECDCLHGPALANHHAALQLLSMAATRVGPYVSLDDSDALMYKARPGAALTLAHLMSQLASANGAKQKNKKPIKTSNKGKR